MNYPEPDKLASLVIKLKERRFETPLPEKVKILAVPLPDPETTQQLGRMLADTLVQHNDSETHAKTTIIGLSGDLGAGKTLFASSFIRSLIPDAHVSSPTYSIVEEYVYPSLLMFHLDLYRVKDVDELEGIGFWDFSAPGTLSLIEWVELYPQTLSSDAVVMEFKYDGERRVVYLYSASESVFDEIIVALSGLDDGEALPFTVESLNLPYC